MKKEDRDIIIGAILIELITSDLYELSEEEKRHTIKSVDPNILPFELLFDSKILKYVNWSLIEIKNLRIAINRNPEIISFIDDEVKNKINFKEIKRAFVIEPEKFFDFNFIYGLNLDNEDIYHLIVNCDIKFFEKFSTVTKQFSSNKKYEIIKAFDFEKDVVTFYDLEEFDSFHICEIAKNIDEEIIDLIPIEKMNVKNWISLLEIKSWLLDRMPKQLLINSDPFYLVSFVCIFPEYQHMIDEKITKSLSTLCWEKLVLAFPEKYGQMIKNMNQHSLVNILINDFDIESKLINLSKINIKEWLRLLRHKREYVKYFDLEMIKKSNINDIVDFIQLYPNKPFVFPEDRKKEVTSLGWEKLLISNKEYFFDICDFYKLTEVSWENVIKVHPDLKVHKF